MVYWEHEEGGSLCTAHDDGGKITAYGYGYYWSKGETEPLLETQRIALDGRNTEAAAELEKQMPPFSFVTYQTSDTGLRLLSGTTGNGHWFLSQGDVWFTYTVSPFFADSYAVTAVSTGITGGTTGVEPGTDALPYQVRSVEQLQYAMKKLRDRQGITLTEMLCTVLIVLLLTALLVVGIRFAGKTYTESMRLSEAQEPCSTLTSVISDKLRFCGTVTQDENGGLTQIFIQNVGSVEGKGDAFQIGEDGQLALGDRHLLGSASYPKGLQVTAFTLRYDASTDIFSVTLEIGDRSRQTLSQTSFDVNRINRTVT